MSTTLDVTAALKEALQDPEVGETLRLALDEPEAPTEDATPRPKGRSGILVREDQVMQRHQVRDRIKALARGMGASEAMVTRNLLLLALARAEREPGLLATAAEAQP